MEVRRRSALRSMGPISRHPRRVALGLVLSAGVFAVAARTVAAQDESSASVARPPSVGPCQLLRSEIDAGANAADVAIKFGLPAEIRVATDKPLSRSFYCTSMIPNVQASESGIVLSVMFVSADGSDAWLVYGTPEPSMNEAAWRTHLADYGFTDVVPFEHGLTTYLSDNSSSTSTPVDLWAAWRRALDGG